MNGNNDDLNPQTTNPDPNQAHTNVDGHNPSEASHDDTAKAPVSEARLRANRKNAKKSTGPKTERGKSWSRRNALKHGLTARSLIFANDTDLTPNLLALREGLHEKYGVRDACVAMLVENLVVECLLQKMALAVELHHYAHGVHFHQGGNVTNTQRYRKESQRAMWKNVDMLEKLYSPTSPAEDEDESEADICAERTENL